MFPERRVATALIAWALIVPYHAEGKKAPGDAAGLSALVAPPPSWIKELQPPEKNNGMGLENKGTIYLLVDRQINVDRSALYYHEVRRLTSENGVQNSGSISVSFQPEYEKVVFHFVRLIRDGKATNRLDPTRVTFSRREKDPERSVYDTAYSAQLTLDDVRVGDMVESSYTVEGANPLSRGKFSSIFTLQWDDPVLRNSLRFIYSDKRKLTFRVANGAAEPQLTTIDGVTELWSEIHNVRGRTVEDDVPDGYRPLPRLTITEFTSWAELAHWAIPLFAIDASPSSEFQAEAEELRAILEPENRVVAALRFVQDEIRSVDVASWVDSRPLTAPAEILRRRFANQFDKTVLLVALLRALDIDAAPALVSDSYRAGVKDQLPSVDPFNHVIVEVRLGKVVHWIDPWRDAQHGPLSQIYVGRLGSALILRSETTGLAEFQAPRDSFPYRKITENYRIPQPAAPADLDVVTEYRGLLADRTRAFFRENTHEEIQKRYLQYYVRTFPQARVAKLLWYEELPGQNACRVTEAYETPNIWQLDEGNHRYTLSIQPGDIDSTLGSDVSVKRDHPWRLGFPLTVEQEMNFEMFERWPIDVKKQETNNKFFKLRDQPTVDGAHLQFNYALEMLRDRVETKDLSRFNDAIRKAKDSLGYTLRYSTPEQLEKQRQPSTFNWAVGAATLCFFCAGTFASYRCFRTSRLPSPRPPPINEESALAGIGGWLVLLAIGHVLRPLGFLKPIYTLVGTTMNTNSWRILTDPIESSYNAWWAPTLLYEIFSTSDRSSFAFCSLGCFLPKKQPGPASLQFF